MNLSEAVRLALQPPLPVFECGGTSGWTEVVILNMSDPSQECPPAWGLVNSPARSCTIYTASCEGVNFTVPVGTYSRVCGRATGYAVGTDDAFQGHAGRGGSVDGIYVDGVSLTHGSPRQHIWSFGAGGGRGFPCTCLGGRQPLPFVGDNYFCDDYRNGALWDGLDCVNGCCTFNSPPYFTAALPTPTSDDIEVRICHDEPIGNEGLRLSLLQIYVQ